VLAFPAGLVDLELVVVKCCVMILVTSRGFKETYFI